MAPETAEFAAVIAGEVGGLFGSERAAEGPVPLEVLERNLTSHAAHIAAAEAEWLGWLGEYCVREGWRSWGCSGPVQWLSWQCGMSPSTAREKVRVALALRELPAIFAEFSAGRLSYSKVRALTRVATPTKETELAELGVAATGAQLDVIVRARKQAVDADKGARSAWRERSWRSRADGEDSTVFTFRVPNDHAELVALAVSAEVNQTIDDAFDIHSDTSRADIIDNRGGWSAMAADAAVALLNGSARTDAVLPAEVEIVVNDDDHRAHSADADPSVSTATNTPAEAPAASLESADVDCDTDSVSGRNDPSVSTATNTPAEAPPTRLQPDDVGDDTDRPSALNRPSVSTATNTPAEALPAAVDHDFSLWGRSLATAVGHRLCCDPRISALIEDAMGTVLGAGRKTRLVSRKLRRALERRDAGHCQFPGCGAERRLHAHHIIHWSNGGPTELDNLILVCSFHHHVVHEGGWNVDRVTRSFVKPDGTFVDPTPSKRFRGSAAEVTENRRLRSPAPLAEAENMPFDLGLVLEGLAFDNAANQHHPDTCRQQAAVPYQPPVPLGPPIPLDLHRERLVQAHRHRHASVYA